MSFEETNVSRSCASATCREDVLGSAVSFDTFFTSALEKREWQLPPCCHFALENKSLTRPGFGGKEEKKLSLQEIELWISSL